MEKERKYKVSVELDFKDLAPYLAKVNVPSKQVSIEMVPEQSKSQNAPPKRKRSEKKQNASQVRTNPNKKAKSAVTRYRCEGFCYTCDPDGKWISNRSSHRKAFADHDIVQAKRQVVHPPHPSP